MGKISYDHIQEILDSFSDKNRALETVKNLLASNGYTEHHDEERLLFINSSGSHTHTIDINLKKYTEEKNIQKSEKQALTATKVIDDQPKQKDINDIVDTILKYHKMLGEGSITQEEFYNIKKDLLS
ncbi:MAG: hypothetical protein U9R13_05430, partial [Campylobacterota bacterium]|nr:hypothetical protein [Campylobacterota bacterium]